MHTDLETIRQIFIYVSGDNAALCGENPIALPFAKYVGQESHIFTHLCSCQMELIIITLLFAQPKGRPLGLLCLIDFPPAHTHACDPIKKGVNSRTGPRVYTVHTVRGETPVDIIKMDGTLSASVANRPLIVVVWHLLLL